MKLLPLLLVLASCASIEPVPEYLVTVQAHKPNSFATHKLCTAANVDTLVTNNFGYAFASFRSDTLFRYSPYFIIETADKTIYAEQKAIRWRNGKMKLCRLRDKTHIEQCTNLPYPGKN